MLKILRHAWPILISQWTGIAFAIIDSAMLGQFSVEALQTISIAASIYVTIVVSLMGVLHALIPICAYAIGAGKDHEVGLLYGQGLWVSLLVTALAVILLWHPSLFLGITGDLSPTVEADVIRYLRYQVFALPAALMFRVVYAICTASQRASTVMYISLASIPVKIGLNWVLIFGQLGVRPMGSDGAAISGLVVFWFQWLLGLMVLHLDPYYRHYRLRFTWPHWTRIAEILRLGIPMAGSYLVEISAFTFITLLAAREGAHVSGAHQILSNLVSFSYMLPMSIGIAMAAGAARHLGAQQHHEAHRTIMAGFALTVIGILLMISLSLISKHQIISLYTQDAQVALIAASLIGFFPIIHFWDANQCFWIFALRAHKIATLPFILQSISLLGVGLGLGFLFGYGSAKGSVSIITQWLMPAAPVGLSSLWLMNATSLMLCGLVLFAWYRYVYKSTAPHLN